MSYSSDHTDLRYSDYNLRRMCDEGAEKFETGFYDLVRFNCYSANEVDVVRAYMKQRYPYIPFTTTHFFGIPA